MRLRTRASVVLAVALLAVIGAFPAPAWAEQAKSRDAVERIIKESGADVAVAFRTLDGSGGSPPRLELLIQPDVEFHAASTMKVPVMIELFRQALAGLARLDEPLQIRNEFASITKIHHDAAIVLAPRPFILVVLVRGIEDLKQSAALIAKIARVIYDEAQAQPADRR